MPLKNPLRVLPPVALALAALLALLALTGCGGEPSSGDIEKAVTSHREKRAQDLRQMSGSASGSDMMPKFHGAKKLGCTNAQGDSLDCQVEYRPNKP